jgi:hypothetical protein
MSAIKNDRAERRRTAEAFGLRFQEEFEDTLDKLALIRLQKCIEYGESRYEETCTEFNRWSLFMDVHRKYIRLRQQMRNKDALGLLETYTDLAAYAGMAVQILSRKTGE